MNTMQNKATMLSMGRYIVQCACPGCRVALYASELSYWAVHRDAKGRILSTSYFCSPECSLKAHNLAYPIREPVQAPVRARAA